MNSNTESPPRTTLPVEFVEYHKDPEGKIMGSCCLKLPKSPIRLVILPFEVEANLADGNACGGWDKRFRAAMSLECVDLDANGFVIENQTLIESIRSYFRAAKYIASCEQLCQCIAHLCQTLVGDRLTKVNVQVFNLTGYTELTWTKGEVVPPLPFCET